MKIDLSNKVIVVTGASRGIGSQMVRRFAGEGANVVINYLNSDVKAIELFKEISSFNKNCMMVKADVTEQEQVKMFCKEVMNKFGRVDVLINNAGICSDNLTLMMTEKQWNEVINTNLSSAFYCSKIFGKKMVKNKKGKIINIASIKGQIGSEGQSNYSASKAGIIGFTKSLAKEMGTFNISVNAVCPGYISTDLNVKNLKKKDIAQKMSVMSPDYYLHELLNFLEFMCSDYFNFISGQVFNIDSRLS